MSDIQKSLFKRKAPSAGSAPDDAAGPGTGTSGLPGVPEGTGTAGPQVSMPPPLRPLSRPRRVKPVPWTDHFEQKFPVKVDGDVDLNVYLNPPSSVDEPLFVFQHGAGSSALSFALVSTHVRRLFGDTGGPDGRAGSDEVAGTMAVDMRSHGDSGDSPDNDFGIDKLAADFLAAIAGVWDKMGWKQGHEPPIVFVGHSLGGSVVAKASHVKGPLQRKIVGLVVMDVVEGLGSESVRAMNRVLDTWPAKFDSIDRAIEWHVSSRTLRNRSSAAVSVPGLLRPIPESGQYTWRLNLRHTEPYWQQWFEGLSASFLTAPAARLLILAGTDRLDKELMIGQMQGKYQLVIFNEAGHFLHEDEPERAATTLVDFWNRNGKSHTIIPAFGKFRTP